MVLSAFFFFSVAARGATYSYYSENAVGILGQAVAARQICFVKSDEN
jgi:hypothetical protein